MKNTLLERSRIFGEYAHSSTNHLYDGKPYAFHILMVLDYARKYKKLLEPLSEESWELIQSAIWCHDTIEDCRKTYMDVMESTSKEVADIVYALTTQKGKTRAERAPLSYYIGIRAAPFATFIKICDRLANAGYSRLTKSSMLQKYKDEQQRFAMYLNSQLFDPMFYELENILFS